MRKSMLTHQGRHDKDLLGKLNKTLPLILVDAQDLFVGVEEFDKRVNVRRLLARHLRPDCQQRCTPHVLLHIFLSLWLQELETKMVEGQEVVDSRCLVGAWAHRCRQSTFQIRV